MPSPLPFASVSSPHCGSAYANGVPPASVQSGPRHFPRLIKSLHLTLRSRRTGQMLRICPAPELQRVCRAWHDSYRVEVPIPGL